MDSIEQRSVVGGRRRFWPLALVLPLGLVVAWPGRGPAARPDPSDLAPLRVAYPQVEILGSADLERLRNRCVLVDAVLASPRTREELVARLGGSAEDVTFVFCAPRDRATAALHAALQARAWGIERAYAYLE
jgi:hypothetical protein